MHILQDIYNNIPSLLEDTALICEKLVREPSEETEELAKLYNTLDNAAKVFMEEIYKFKRLR